MHDPVQHLALLFVPEHDLAESLAVELAGGEENGGAKGASDGAQAGGAGGDDGAREEVGVDDGDVVRGEKGGDGGFACGYSAC